MRKLHRAEMEGLSASSTRGFCYGRESIDESNCRTKLPEARAEATT